ncbi:MAG TPA: hypothetical protein VLV83_24945 [Acidobacteriota bacterium]|nr:hypothetical protein [Acidobacteriota bacterium]
MAKDAVILLAGLQQEDLTRSVDSAARRLASAFDQEAVTEAAFRVEEGSQEDYGQTSQYKTRVVAISRQDHEPQPQTIADLYGFDYRQSLVSDLQTKRPINHLLGTFWILLANAPRLLLSIRRRSKKSADKWQVRFGMLVYFILFVYFLLIVGAAAGSVATVAEAQMGDGVQESSQTGGNQSDADQSGQNAEDQTGLVGYLGRVSRPMQWVVVWVTAIGLFLRFDLKTWIEHSGRSIAAASQYLAFDRRRSALADQFAALLNHIGEKGTNTARSTSWPTVSAPSSPWMPFFHTISQPRSSAASKAW